MKSLIEPPTLKGFNSFSSRDVFKCIKQNGLLSLWIEPSLYCKYKCVYCYTRSNSTHSKEELNFDKIITILSESATLGTKGIIISGGEPLLYPNLDRLIREIRRHKMIPVIFTNGYNITRQKAKFFFDNDCSIMLKLDSLENSVQDKFTGILGSLVSIKRSLKNLRLFNFNSNSEVLRLGISAVITKNNLNEIPSLWKFSRKNQLFPHFEPVGYEGRAKPNFRTIGISMATARSIYDNLLSIDEKQYCFTWNKYSALPAMNCKQLLYSLNATANGKVTICNGIPLIVGNLKKQTLKQILNSNIVFKYRSVCKQIKPPDLSKCYGCRARAYNLRVDMYAADPIWQPEIN